MLSEENFIRELTVSQDRLFAFILTILPRADDARDVLQETHIQMWKMREQFVEGTHFVAWACQIARYKVLEYRRATARDNLVFDESLVDQLAKDAGQHAEQCEERMGILEICLARLTPRQRALIGERYGSGRLVKQMAERLGRSASALAVALFRIRQALLDCMERTLAEGAQE